MPHRSTCLAGALLLTSLLLAFSWTGVRAQEAFDENRAVPLQGATSAQVDLDMRFGRLIVNPATSAVATPAAIPAASPGAGSDVLLNARFRFSNEDWRPEVDYSVDSATGSLDVSQSGSEDIDIDDIDDVTEGDIGNRWDLEFNRDVPLDLDIDATAGDVQVNAGGLTIDRLDIDVEAGRAELDLTGEWVQAPEKIKVESTSGQVVLRLPRDIGVRVDADAGVVGDIDADDELESESGDYVNAAYGETPMTLNVEADTTVGQIVLQLEDE